MTLLPTKQNLGHIKTNTPAKSSQRSLFEQFTAIKDIMLLSPVPYIHIKIVVTSQKSRFYSFQTLEKATPYKAFRQILDMNWKSTKCY